jgi:hypothetical protein
MEKILIIENIVNLLLRGSIPYSELYTKYFQSKGTKKSELSSCIKELKQQGFIDYEGDSDDDVDLVLTRFGEEMLGKYTTYARYLKSQNVTKYDEVVRWGKNNIFIVFLILLITIIGAIAGLVDKGKQFVNDFQTTDSAKVITQKTIPDYKPLMQQRNDSVPHPSTPTSTSGSSHVKAKTEGTKLTDTHLRYNNDFVLSLTPDKFPYSCGYLSQDEKEWIITNCIGYSSDGRGTGTMEKIQTLLPIGDYLVIFNIALGKFIPKDDINTSKYPSSEYEDFNIIFKVSSIENNKEEILAQQVLPYTNFSRNFKEVKLKFKVDELHSRTFLSFPIDSPAVTWRANEIRVKNITIKRII